jgi:hypothetical protein
MPLHTFLHNLLIVLVQIANKIGLQNKNQKIGFRAAVLKAFRTISQPFATFLCSDDTSSCVLMAVLTI